jgi:hypothetical protein
MTTPEFHHFGVPTSTKSENEVYVAGAKVHVSDPEVHPYRVEFLRFDKESPLPEAVRTQPHAAFIVPSLDAALAGRKVIIPPFDATDTFRCAFISDGDAVIELMQRR